MRIKQARNKAGLNQRELADLLDLHFRTVQNWESQKNPVMPEFKRLDDIAKVLGVDKGWLLQGDPPEDAPEIREQVAELRADFDALGRRMDANFEALLRSLLERLDGEHRETS